VRVANRAVELLLRSPAHRLASGSLDVIRYQAPRSGSTVSTPTQYAEDAGQIVILVGRPETKTWWRAFRSPHPLEILVRGRWLAMTGSLVDVEREPAEVAHLLDVYTAKFPRASKGVGDDVMFVVGKPR
jgi:hypothetical protein